ncbi:hypothetical protein B0H17DRAFT_1218419 [Mycena rosella]|uniref:Uncharacterized protein n=1 Tax=Mycena rosella TaxID=1033263 RepID=A0AAD7BRI4_MYCRO|nr:hypothetical protein B0H17DRAFT_1218419 [Mycena rosella]
MQQHQHPRARTANNAGQLPASRAGSAAVIDRPPTSSSTTVPQNRCASTTSRSSQPTNNATNNAIPRWRLLRLHLVRLWVRSHVGGGPDVHGLLMLQPVPPVRIISVFLQHIPMPLPTVGTIPMSTPAPAPALETCVSLLPQPHMPFALSLSSFATSLGMLRTSARGPVASQAVGHGSEIEPPGWGWGWMEEWRRRTEEEAPHNTLLPPSPLSFVAPINNVPVEPSTHPLLRFPVPKCPWIDGTEFDFTSPAPRPLTFATGWIVLLKPKLLADNLKLERVLNLGLG